ncbi:hypothetical protein NDU88_009682 [Pleurodeles waltl]|uniref:Uncharacterized protein n=1 Tax=Pleurodeles waltl TaxID=8319 RepID=A0AAV7QY06_PLEWA|nr:hypothetical protein NDU88_009682 [Pleurodeles waltl]
MMDREPPFLHVPGPGVARALSPMLSPISQAGGPVTCRARHYVLAGPPSPMLLPAGQPASSVVDPGRRLHFSPHSSANPSVGMPSLLLCTCCFWCFGRSDHPPCLSGRTCTSSDGLPIVGASTLGPPIPAASLAVPGPRLPVSARVRRPCYSFSFVYPEGGDGEARLCDLSVRHLGSAPDVILL